MNIYEILFSPRGGTQKVADIFAAAFHQEVEVVDLTDSSYDFSAVSIEEDDVCIIAAPSYADRVPPLAARRLSLIHGNHARAVLIAVERSIPANALRMELPGGSDSRRPSGTDKRQPLYFLYALCDDLSTPRKKTAGGFWPPGILLLFIFL